MTTNQNPKWDDDSIQFPRLIAEIAATIEFTEAQRAELCESMDLQPDDIDELFDRAQTAWERIKGNIVQGQAPTQVTACADFADGCAVERDYRVAAEVGSDIRVDALVDILHYADETAVETHTTITSVTLTFS